LVSIGPVVPMQPPRTLAHTTKKRPVSSVLPGPIISCHQPSLPVIGCGSAANWSPVKAWQTRMALLRAGLSAP
jgi:hypothetical protein